MKPLVRKKKILIDYTWALELVNDEIAKEGPEYVYPYAGDQCYNTVVIDGEIVGSCLVGRALIAAGVPAEELHLKASVTDVAETEDVLDDLFGLTPQARYFLAGVQGCQDTGIPWGEALEDSVRHCHRPDGSKHYFDEFGDLD